MPITTATLFDIGSRSKQFAAAGIALLAEEQKLSFNDVVRKYIPEPPENGAPLTIDTSCGTAADAALPCAEQLHGVELFGNDGFTRVRPNTRPRQVEEARIVQPALRYRATRTCTERARPARFPVMP